MPRNTDNKENDSIAARKRQFRMTGPVAVAAILCLLALLLPRKTNKVPPPTPAANRDMKSLDSILGMRRSTRDFTEHPLSDSALRALAWAAQGITEPTRGFRTAPSAGALFPLRLYVATTENVLRYRPETDRMEEHISGDLRRQLSEDARGQEFIAKAPAVFIITADFSITRAQYGERAERYVWIEVGHAAQNLLLQATALNLSGVPVGAFDESAIHAALQLPENQRPCYMIPVGVASASEPTPSH